MAPRKRIPMIPKVGPTKNDRKRTFSEGVKTRKRKHGCGGKLKK